MEFLLKLLRGRVCLVFSGQVFSNLKFCIPMQKHYENLFDAFSLALAEVDAKHSDVMESFPGAMAVCQEYLVLLRRAFDGQGALSVDEEVAFFKTVKPRFYAERMYRFERYQLVLNRPVGTDEMVRDYLEGELGVLHRFFSMYRFQYLYFKEKGCEFDGLYFVRGVSLPYSFVSAELDVEAGYSTGMDYLFAKFLAYGRLREDILSELAGLPMAVKVMEPAKKKRFCWSGEVINLVELGYAVWLSGQLDSGKAGLQEIFRWLEESFGVEIGIPANRFREIRRRKRLSRTHFMELCQSKLLAYMDEDDVYKPGKKKRGIGFY